MCIQWPKAYFFLVGYFHSYFPNLKIVKKSALGKSLGNLEEVCIFEAKWPKAIFIASNPILELQSISISPMTLIILGQIQRRNKNTFGETNVLINAVAKKPLYH